MLKKTPEISSLQTLENQRGEITFRRKLTQQQVKGEQIFSDEFDRSGIKKILGERMDATLKRMRSLRNDGLTMTPYVEIGAERGQRSLVMESDLNMRGAAFDLSFDMLQSCEYYRSVFRKDRIPLRICGDLYSAPFKTDSIPFVFCYQTLHHFPDPNPLVEEVHRFLAPGGYFLFDEEPYKRGIHLNLYRTSKVFSEQHLHRNLCKKILDHLFAEYICNEVEHGVTENDDISIKTWRKIFNIFAEKNIELSSSGSISSDLYQNGFSLGSILNYIWGGSISGICRKAGNGGFKVGKINESLTCPVCLRDGYEPDLNSKFRCEKCKTSYPTVDGVVFLLMPDKIIDLYPEIKTTQSPG